MPHDFEIQNHNCERVLQNIIAQREAEIISPALDLLLVKSGCALRNCFTSRALSESGVVWSLPNTSFCVFSVRIAVEMDVWSRCVFETSAASLCRFWCKTISNHFHISRIVRNLSFVKRGGPRAHCAAQKAKSTRKMGAEIEIRKKRETNGGGLIALFCVVEVEKWRRGLVIFGDTRFFQSFDVTVFR